jgi:hypothetical protein
VASALRRDRRRDHAHLYPRSLVHLGETRDRHRPSRIRQPEPSQFFGGAFYFSCHSPVEPCPLDWDFHRHWIPETPSLWALWANRLPDQSLLRSLGLRLLRHDECLRPRILLRSAFSRLVPDTCRFFDVDIRWVPSVSLRTGSWSSKPCWVNRASMLNTVIRSPVIVPLQSHRSMLVSYSHWMRCTHSTRISIGPGVFVGIALDSILSRLPILSTRLASFGETSILYPPRFKSESTF